MSKEYLYKKIEKELLRRITRGVYQEGELIPGTKELALEFKTSGVTIDRALTSMVERGIVTRTARKGTHVLPKDSWRSVDKTPADIAIMLHESPSPYFWSKALQGINVGIEQHRRHLVVGNHHGDFSETEGYIKSLRERNISGLIYVPIPTATESEYHSQNERILSAAESIGLPYIMFDRYVNKDSGSHVVSNDYDTACLLTEELLSAGARNPICVTRLYASSFAERERGFLDTLKRHDIGNPGNHIHRVDPAKPFVMDEYEDEIIELVSKRKADGILAVNGELLVASLTAINARMSTTTGPVFVNFDDVGTFRDSRLIMSAIQNSYYLGKLAAELLLDIVEKWNKALFQVVHPFEVRRYLPINSSS